MEELRYPVGRFRADPSPTDESRGQCIALLRALPDELRAAVRGVTASQLATPYRPDGWTLRQLLHHIPDSHMNAYVRFKQALTEDAPAITAYDEAAWARLPDVDAAHINVSLALLEALHGRWCLLLDTLSGAAWQRTYLHPEMGPVTLDTALQIYAWHSRHHLAHVHLVCPPPTAEPAEVPPMIV